MLMIRLLCIIVLLESEWKLKCPKEKKKFINCIVLQVTMS